jgi:hypothetical protein
VATATVGGSGIGVEGISDGASGYGVYGSATNTGNTGATGVYGITTSETGYGVQGVATDTSSNGATGVYGTTTSPTGNGVKGAATDTSSNGATGVYGTSSSPTGYGVHGVASDTSSNGATGVYGTTESPTGYGAIGYAINGSGTGVQGLVNGSGKGVLAENDNSTAGYGLYAEGFTAAYATAPNTKNAIGLYATGFDGINGVALSGSGFGVTATSSGSLTTNQALNAVGTSYLEGNVGIGTAPSTTDPIYTASGAYLSSAGAWTNASSRDYKQDIKELSGVDALSMLRAVAIHRFKFKEERGSDHRERIGVIAEELPDLVASADRKGAPTAELIALALASSRALDVEVQQLKAQNANLEARLATLEGAKADRNDSTRPLVPHWAWLMLGFGSLPVGLALARRRLGRSDQE